MNTDDEHVNSSSRNRSIDLTSRPPSSTHSYVTTLNHPPSSSSHNNRPDPPGSSMTSSPIHHSLSPQPDLDMNSRRRSNTSADSNEFSYQSGPPSNTPMRPFTAGAATSEPHVKLTPITRKISKAKKGVPVHTCNQCPKTFSRAEHLRRHQLSHSAPDLFCPVQNCNKTFHRKDLLDRHVQRHEQDDIDKSPKHPTRSGPKTPTLPPDPTPKQGLQMPSIGPNVVGPWVPVASTSGPNPSYNTPPMDNPSDPYSIGPNNYVLHTLSPNNNFVTDYEPRNISEMPMIPTIPDDTTPELRWPDGSMSSSTPTSTFSTPPANARRSQFPVPTTNGSWLNPTQAYSSNMPTNSMDNDVYPGPYPYTTTPPQAYPSVFNDMELGLPGYSEGTPFSASNQIPTSTVRSISPSLAVAQSETLVAVPSLPASGGVFNLGGCSSGTPDGSLLRTEDLMPLSLPPAAKETIPRYLETYWEKVHPRNPIIHKHTYEDVPEEEKEHVQVLQCAMAALATQFIPNADDRMKGAQLHAYAWQRSKVVVNDQRTFSSRPSTRGHSAWKAWIAAETQRRLLAACFLLDVHSSRYHERQYVSATGLDYSSPNTLPIPLTATTEKPWEAENPQTWSRLRIKKDPKTILSTNMEMLRAPEIASAPAFDTAILLAACSLSLPWRQSPAHIGPMEDASNFKPDRMPLSRVFPDSAVASTYLALQHTPLYSLLSVSGRSWVFNKKVTDFSVFAEHQRSFGTWCNSGTAVIATVFAARALKLFLRLKSSSSLGEDSEGESGRQQMIPLADISDYWGIYVCSLVCWAYSAEKERGKTNVAVPREATKQWILTVADLEPSQLRAQGQHDGAQGVVSLVKEVLASDCLGGGNILYADAVNVLKQLERGATGISCAAV
ncbi:hypothetical protein F53441_174 [Fusarium austroafricanum]|uniref:C2H2-type domain-containing protein n=1 Tax=Fusarium austroafricanum TaxID=2364996 RepID=A0A8H4KV28_9HYPO|nr:hypothetical protein F53441_174 [Fusarium austroafricanum]